LQAHCGLAGARAPRRRTRAAQIGSLHRSCEGEGELAARRDAGALAVDTVAVHNMSQVLEGKQWTGCAAGRGKGGCAEAQPEQTLHPL